MLYKCFDLSSTGQNYRTLSKKEKMFLTNIFSFPTIFFKRLPRQGRKNKECLLNSFLRIYSFWHKMSNFTFFLNVSYPICILKSFNSYISVVVCSFFEDGGSLKIVWSSLKVEKEKISPFCTIFQKLSFSGLFNPFLHKYSFLHTEG